MFEKEDLLGNVRGHEAAFRATLEKLRDLPIVGDVRGDGYFYGIELVKDKATRETFTDDESERLLRGFLSHALFDAGLICRADDRGDPVIQLAPPLTCTQEHFDEMEQILRSVLTRGVVAASDALNQGSVHVSTGSPPDPKRSYAFVTAETWPIGSLRRVLYDGRHTRCRQRRDKMRDMREGSDVQQQPRLERTGEPQRARGDRAHCLRSPDPIRSRRAGRTGSPGLFQVRWRLRLRKRAGRTGTAARA